MDRIAFMQALSTEAKLRDTMINYFDQIMGIYEIIGNLYPNINISIDENTSPSFIFTIRLDSGDDTDLVYKILNNKIMSIYGHDYLIELAVSDYTLNVQIKDKTSG